MEGISVFSHVVDQIEAEPETSDPIWRASTGLVLRLRVVPGSIPLKLAEKFPAPEAPLIPAEDEEGKFYQNMADPDYEQAMKKYHNDLNELSVQLYLAHGTEIASLAPGMEGPDGHEWENRLADSDILGLYTIEVPKSGRSRYVAWLRLSGVLRDADFSALLRAVQRNSGQLFEEDVAEAARSFSGDEGGGAPTGVADAESEPVE